MTARENDPTDTSQVGQRANLFFLLQKLSRVAEINNRDAVALSEVSDEQKDEHKRNNGLRGGNP